MTPTQVQHPWRTTLRTVVWLIIALAPTVPTLWAIVQDEVAKAGLTIPANVGTAVAYGVAVIVALVGIVQRLVLIPAVAALIAKIPGLSPTPPEVHGEIDPVSPSTVAGSDMIVHTDANGDQTTNPLS